MVIFAGMSDDSIKDHNIKNSVKNCDTHKYVMAFTNIVDNNLLPDNFDVWNVQQRYTWINKNLNKFFPNVPQSLLRYIPALYHEPKFDRSPIEIPEWLDIDKYERGQQFVRKYYTSIIISKIFGLLHVFSFNENLKPIIQNRHADTLYLGFERYLSTILRISSWYNGQPWVKDTAAYKTMQFAHKQHLLMRKKLNELDDEQIEHASKIVKPSCPDRDLLLQNFIDACPFEKSGQRPYLMFEKSLYKPKGLHANSIALTQCSFISTMLLNPQYIGAYDATDKDLEAFCHMWRYYGYCLGLEDEHNFCYGSLEEIKERMRDYYHYWIIPNLKEITPEWEHMTRCIVEPLNYYPLLYVPYKVMILMAMNAINLDMPSLYTSLNYPEWIAYKVWRFLLQYAMKFSIFRTVFNLIIHKIIDIAVNFSAEKRAQLKKRSEEQFST